MNQFKGFPIIDYNTILTPMNQDNITPSIHVSPGFHQAVSPVFIFLGPFQFSSPHLYRFESTALPRSQNAPWWNRTHQFQWWPLRLVRHSLRYESVVPGPRRASLEGQQKQPRWNKNSLKKTPHFHHHFALPESHIHHWNLEIKRLKKWWTWLQKIWKPHPHGFGFTPLSLPGTARTRAYDF